LDYYLGDPVSSSLVISKFRKHKGFDHDMEIEDRDAYSKLAYSVSQPLSYYALEDGSFAGYYVAHGYYREPGNAGYDAPEEDDDTSTGMGKHWMTCVDRSNGTQIPCVLKEGDPYVVCQDGHESSTRPGLCEVIDVCPGQPDCSIFSVSEGEAYDKNATSAHEECLANLKYCRQYTIETNTETKPRGALPLTLICIDENGQFTDTGSVLDPRGDSRDPKTNTVDQCTYDDGTAVTRRLAADFAYCGRRPRENNDEDDNTADANNSSVYETCDDAFAGMFHAFPYDPRYREWYQLTKEYQRSNWSPPYIYVPNLKVGLTYTEPLYDIDDQGRQIFAGALAVDFRCK
jgi:hypothetical protein